MFRLKTVGSAKKFKKTWVFGSPICNFPYSCSTDTGTRFGEESRRTDAGLQRASGRARTHCLFDSATSLSREHCQPTHTLVQGGRIYL